MPTFNGILDRITLIDHDCSPVGGPNVALSSICDAPSSPATLVERARWIECLLCVISAGGHSYNESFTWRQKMEDFESRINQLENAN